MSTPKQKPFDTVFLGIVLALLGIGVFVFISASLGILAKNTDKFYGVVFNQIVLGLGIGGVLLYVTSRIPYKAWRKYSLHLFVLAIAVTALVFVPGLGFRHGGAQRWLALGPVSFQPAELLKIAFVIYFASWLSWIKGKAADLKIGIAPLLGFFAVMTFVLFRQPDTKSFILMAVAALAMLVMGGLKWRYVFGAAGIIAVGLAVLLFFKPYLKDRFLTFIDQSRDPSGSSYQLRQSLIAIGSGEVLGRGYGHSIQKFSYLPEPQGDSIFAVVGEEFGFVGSSLLVLLFVVFALRGLKIAYQAPDQFSRLLVTGLVTLLTAQSFLNIASITGLFPLTGVPLVFISHGGTALMFSLASVGIILQVSRHARPVSTMDRPRKAQSTL